MKLFLGVGRPGFCCTHPEASRLLNEQALEPACPFKGWPEVQPREAGCIRERAQVFSEPRASLHVCPVSLQLV